MRPLSAKPATHADVDAVRHRLEPDSSFARWMPPGADDGRTLAWHAATGSCTQRLTPRHPPGRTNRKARAYAEEITRLRAAGYGLKEIREALADAGVFVSKSTVHREATRLASPSQSGSPLDLQR